MFSLEERERAVELYFTTPMTTAQVVEHLGYPTRQCLERWLAMDSRYAGHMAKPIIPLETRRRAVELVLGGMQQKQAAKQLGVSVGAVHGWVRAYRKGGMAALQPKNRNSAQGNKPADSRRRPSAADDDDAEALRRRVEELELENALMREVVEVVKKDPGADLRRLSNREKMPLRKLTFGSFNDVLVEVPGDQFHPLALYAPLVDLAGIDQLAAVDDHELVRRVDTNESIVVVQAHRISSLILQMYFSASSKISVTCCLRFGLVSRLGLKVKLYSSRWIMA